MIESIKFHFYMNKRNHHRIFCIKTEAFDNYTIAFVFIKYILICLKLKLWVIIRHIIAIWIFEADKTICCLLLSYFYLLWLFSYTNGFSPWKHNTLAFIKGFISTVKTHKGFLGWRKYCINLASIFNFLVALCRPLFCL